MPNEHIFQQFETEDGKVYREREVTNLLDDPEYQFLDSYEPEFIAKSSAQVFPTGSDLKQQLCPPQASPLDIRIVGSLQSIARTIAGKLILG